MCRGNKHGGRRCPASVDKAKRSAQNRAYYLKHRKATEGAECSHLISEVSDIFEKLSAIPGVFGALSWYQKTGVDDQKDGTPKELREAYLNYASGVSESFDGGFQNGEFSYQIKATYAYTTPAFLFDEETGGSEPLTTEVAGQINNANGEEVGYWTRRICFPEGRAPYAKYDILCVEEGYQGKGIGAGAVRHFDKVMKKWGVDKVEIEANMDVGGYAWAKNGYDWDPTMGGDAELSWLEQQGRLSIMLGDYAKRNGDPDGSLAKMADRLHTSYDTETYPTPFEFSQVGRKTGDEMWAGKEVLLNTSWHGVRKL